MPSTTILGRQAALPIGIAPAALHGMAHEEGEKATARAATAAGVLHVVSTAASQTIEDVAEAAPGGRRWFQLYVQRNRSVSRELVRRAEAAGYEAICLTVDLPVLGYRDAVVRCVFDPGEDAYANLPKREAWHQTADMDDNLDMRGVGLTWDVLDEIRSWSSLPLVLKGILTGEDAALAVEHGADGVWVSNHGGRQLDRTAAVDRGAGRGRARRRRARRGLPRRRRSSRPGGADRARAGRDRGVHGAAVPVRARVRRRGGRRQGVRDPARRDRAVDGAAGHGADRDIGRRHVEPGGARDRRDGRRRRRLRHRRPDS